MILKRSLPTEEYCGPEHQIHDQLQTRQLPTLFAFKAAHTYMARYQDAHDPLRPFTQISTSQLFEITLYPTPTHTISLGNFH